MLIGALNTIADRLADYSPELATAQAMAEVRQTFADIRRAQEAGPELARFVEAQSKATQAFEDMKVELLEKLAPFATAMMELITELMPLIKLLTVTMSPLLQTLIMIGKVAAFFKAKKEEDDTDAAAEGFNFNPQSIGLPNV